MSVSDVLSFSAIFTVDLEDHSVFLHLFAFLFAIFCLTHLSHVYVGFIGREWKKNPSLRSKSTFVLPVWSRIESSSWLVNDCFWLFMFDSRRTIGKFRINFTSCDAMLVFFMNRINYFFRHTRCSCEPLGEEILTSVTNRGNHFERVVWLHRVLRKRSDVLDCKGI